MDIRRAISWVISIAIHANHNFLVIGCLVRGIEGHAMPSLSSIDTAACSCSVVPYSDNRGVKQQRTLQAIQGIGSDPMFDPLTGTNGGCSSANPSPEVNRIGDLCISSRGSVNWACKMTEYTKQCDYKNDLCYLPGMHRQVALPCCVMRVMIATSTNH